MSGVCVRMHMGAIGCSYMHSYIISLDCPQMKYC